MTLPQGPTYPESRLVRHRSPGAETLQHDAQRDRFKPLWRPFVVRPTAWMAVPAAFLAAAWYFFREPIAWLLGPYADLLPAIALAAVVLTFFARLVRYRKTSYEVGPEGIVVETGTLLWERTVQLDLESITLVEWASPFLLRRLYDCGHVTVQEAGSSGKPAHLSYVDDPGALYDRIGELMGERGFSMERTERIRQETPGHLGAAVDLVSRQLSLLTAAAIFLLQFPSEALALLVGDGPSLLQLLVGNYEVFAHLFERAIFTRIQTGAIVLGGLTLVGLLAWVTTLYLDYLHRTYTLYEDVIDYEDGFLNETRRYIPLENLADSQVSRPFHKRILGLSDVTLSSEGAENDVVFESTPNGPEFAEAIRRMVERSPEVGEADRPPGSDPEESRSPEPGAKGTPQVSVELRPRLIRAASYSFFYGWLGLGLGLVAILPFYLVPEGGPTDPGLAPSTLAGAVLFILFGSAALALFTASGRLIKAWGTTFVFDSRGAHHTFDLLSKNERNFELERITSVSVYRNPVDWLLGTMWIRFRSTGADEEMDFWAVRYSEETLETIRRALGLDADPDSSAEVDVTPEYGAIDGIKAVGPIYAFPAALVALGSGAVIAFDVPYAWTIVSAASVVSLLTMLLHQVLRGLYQGRFRGAVTDESLAVRGGIFRDFRHLAALEHVKSMESLRYPSSGAGRLTFGTPGFRVRSHHVPRVETKHERIDWLLGREATEGDPEEASEEYHPGAFTEVLRRSWTLLAGYGLLYLPYVFAFYRRARYLVEPGRVSSDDGLYFDRRTTILFDRIDHLESHRIPAHWLADTYDVRIFTLGTHERGRQWRLALRSVARSSDLLDRIRRRVSSATN